jgi:hypothetical protein
LRFDFLDCAQPNFYDPNCSIVEQPCQAYCLTQIVIQSLHGVACHAKQPDELSKGTTEWIPTARYYSLDPSKRSPPDASSVRSKRNIEVLDSLILAATSCNLLDEPLVWSNPGVSWALAHSMPFQARHQKQHGFKSGLKPPLAGMCRDFSLTLGHSYR